jgi:hypothetical protein
VAQLDQALALPGLELAIDPLPGRTDKNREILLRRSTPRNGARPFSLRRMAFSDGAGSGHARAGARRPQPAGRSEADAAAPGEPLHRIFHAFLVDQEGRVRNIYLDFFDPRLVLNDVRTLLLEEKQLSGQRLDGRTR